MCTGNRSRPTSTILATAFRFTTAARGCLDLTSEFGLAAGLLAADAGVRRGLFDTAELAACYAAAGPACPRAAGCWS